jgi:DNA-binding MarR family transcriptional regulator
MAPAPPERALLTDEQIGTWRALVAVHARLSVQLEADLVAEHGLPLVEYEVLVQLLDAPDRRLRMTELADRVVLSRSGITRLVDRMEREGLVERAVCDEDGRGTYAVLTDGGTARLRQASGTYFRGLRTYLVDRADGRDVTTLRDVLDAVLADDGVVSPRRRAEPSSA